MTLLNDLTPHTLQFYLTAPYPCSYLPGRTARSLMAAPNELVDSEIYGQLVRLGFRRSGLYTYRPQCLACNACVPVRLDVAAFAPSRTQQRTWKRLANLSAQPRELHFNEEHYRLYRHYQADFPSTVRSYCKKVFQPTRGAMVPLAVRQAWKTMVTGRPGPVTGLLRREFRRMTQTEGVPVK